MSLALALLAVAATMGAPPPAAPPCRAGVDGIGDGTPASQPSRPVATRDLLALRDFGGMGPADPAQAIFALSPDRRYVALQLRRGDPTTNSYCLALVTVELATGLAKRIDDGGELVTLISTWRGRIAGYAYGVPRVIVPSWSPDGRWVVVLKRYGGITQAWRVRSDGSAREQLTHEMQDVDAATWSSDGHRLIYRSDRALTRSREHIEQEGSTGWSLDDRYFPQVSARPFPQAGAPDEQVFALDIASRDVVRASPTDRIRLDESAVATRTSAIAPQGAAVALASTEAYPGHYMSRHHLELRRGAAAVTCIEVRCTEARSFWLSDDGSSVLLQGRDGWGGGDQSFSRWNATTGRVTFLSKTSDYLLGCEPLDRRLLCARETSVSPRQLVLVDPRTGRERVVFDPNPEYDRLEKGRVERLRLTAANGTRTFADVMLPPGFVAGRRYPMVVVQYQSRGFLRGGTGEEFPIPPLASAGIVVLSFERTADVADTVVPPPKDDDDFLRIDTRNWADRRNVHSAVMDGVRQVIARGWADPARIGITGLSDGIGEAGFALVNSPIFSVAALTSCCEEPISSLAFEGQEFSRHMLAAGLPPLIRPDPAFWAPYSVAQNATRVRAPLLLQVADREMMFSLPTIEALREAKLPLDVHVFPNEMHIKWQPAHKLAVYDRVLRWFAFWFDLPVDLAATAPAGELERWRELRSTWRDRARPAATAITNAAAPTPPHR